MSKTARQKRNLANLQAKWKIFTVTPLRWFLICTRMSLEDAGGTGDVQVAWSCAQSAAWGHPEPRLGLFRSQRKQRCALKETTEFVTVLSESSVGRAKSFVHTIHEREKGTLKMNSPLCLFLRLPCGRKTLSWLESPIFSSCMT